jgi:hypothetical protein
VRQVGPGDTSLAKYYRAFKMADSAIPSHMQLWSDDQGPFLIQDWRMMFGCRAAASFASRVSGFICWLLADGQSDGPGVPGEARAS